ncbi:excalibur calcium-binding domain-containing protein [Streptomyces sp. NPDC002120]|uniref:excalibur calcium-binding domain-containing protein n=1 Tax=Streptomyces sp. NPDC002120 TaxID=3364631 RepID=UPI00369EA9E5
MTCPAATGTRGAGSACYRNCDAAKAAGAAPIRKGQPGYRSASTRTATASPATSNPDSGAAERQVRPHEVGPRRRIVAIPGRSGLGGSREYEARPR